MGRILVIRGGALGDFILTLPAIRLLREAFPQAHLEVLGYQQFIRLAQAAGLVDGAQSIEYAKLAPFFARQTILDPDLMHYFGSFHIVVSYLFDPDEHFAKNLERSAVKTHLRGIHKPTESNDHAALQLAKPLESLALFAEDLDLRRQIKIPAAGGVTTSRAPRTLALHPGSGSTTKNWPAGNWIDLAKAAIAQNLADEILLITGEVEAATGLRDKVLDGLANEIPLRHLDHAPLTEVAEALAATSAFVGNDSGVTHLAGALGIPTLALFGPTDAEVWAPWGEQVTVLRPEGNKIEAIPLATVLEALARSRSS